MQKSELEIYKRAMDEVAHILITNGEGTITYVNDKYCKLTKYSREELIGQNNRIFKSDYHSREFFENMYKELGSGNLFKAKFKNIAKDGSYFWMDATIIPFLNENNVPYQFLAVRFDITDKINEVERKEEFLADISHEIRSPLHGLLSLVNLLSETKLNKEQTEYIKHINETSNHLGHLVNDLLDIFKIDSGKLQFELIPFDIRQITSSLVEIFNVNEKKHKIEFIYRIDEKIHTLLLGDPTRLRQILFNLLGNALKFTEKGIVNTQVLLSHETTDYQFVEFRIIDTGKGISKEKQEEIFDKFMQSDVKDTRLYGGTGLGMNIVKSLIELQNGSLSLQSKEGEGTTFRFTIPYKKQSQSIEFTGESTILTTNLPFKKLNILIAEDDKINQLIYRKQMQKFNYNCKLAENGFEALDLLQQETFDLLLLDMQMPGMNGDEVLRKIRNEFPEPVRNIPVICVSATVHERTIQALIDAGADGHLNKPYKEIELVEIINKTLKKSNSHHLPLKPAAFFNLDVLKSFADDDTHFIIELLEYFKTTTPDELERMQQNFSTNNIELPKQLHKYRSQVSLLGLPELTQLTLTLENALNEADDFELYRSDFEDLLAKSEIVILEVALLITKLNNK